MSTGYVNKPGRVGTGVVRAKGGLQHHTHASTPPGASVHTPDLNGPPIYIGVRADRFYPVVFT
jgi:hypothetical protein